MVQRQRVLLFGQSVILGAVRASLDRVPDLDVCAVAPPATAQELVGLRPDAILFDTDADCSATAYAAQRAKPELLLIGIDPANNELVMIWTHTERPQSIADLVDVISRERPAAPSDGSKREPGLEKPSGGAP